MRPLSLNLRTSLAESVSVLRSDRTRSFSMGHLKRGGRSTGEASRGQVRTNLLFSAPRIANLNLLFPPCSLPNAPLLFLGSSGCSAPAALRVSCLALAPPHHANSTSRRR